MRYTKIYIYSENLGEPEDHKFASYYKIPYYTLLGTVRVYFKQPLYYGTQEEVKNGVCESALKNFLAGKKSFKY